MYSGIVIIGQTVTAGSTWQWRASPSGGWTTVGGVLSEANGIFVPREGEVRLQGGATAGDNDLQFAAFDSTSRGFATTAAAEVASGAVDISGKRGGEFGASTNTATMRIALLPRTTGSTASTAASTTATPLSTTGITTAAPVPPAPTAGAPVASSAPATAAVSSSSLGLIVGVAVGAVLLLVVCGVVAAVALKRRSGGGVDEAAGSSSSSSSSESSSRTEHIDMDTVSQYHNVDSLRLESGGDETPKYHNVGPLRESRA